MIKIIRPFVLISLLIFSFSSGMTQEVPFQTRAFNKNIKSLQIFKKGYELSEPILTLSSEEKLLIQFDFLGGDEPFLYYRLHHCNADWSPSQLMSDEYIQGFQENEITELSHSFNTNIAYVHYNLEFPNENVTPLVSGNYAMEIYDSSFPDSTLATFCFYVLDRQVSVLPKVKYATQVDLQKKNQEVDFIVDHSNYPIRNPLQEVQVVLRQNHRKDNQVTSIKPTFIRSNSLVYDFNKKNIFPGGQEYRPIDIKSMKYLAPGLQDISFHTSFYHVQLIPGELRGTMEYEYIRDINGNFVIRKENAADPNVESDYVFVHFSLPVEKPYIHGEVFLLGNFLQNHLDKNSKMTFNFETNQYEKTLLLKQGYYNFLYLYKPIGEKVGQLAPLEGTHWQTENTYEIWVYHRPIGDRYDHLVGYHSFSSQQAKH